MNEFEATAAVIGIFALRCIAPLALTVALGYLMNRIVDRWQVEEAIEVKGSAAVSRAKTKQRLSLPVIDLPCWVFNNCTPEAQVDCAARKEPAMPCWIARLKAEGVLPKTCPDCPIYQTAMAAAALT